MKTVAQPTSGHVSTTTAVTHPVHQAGTVRGPSAMPRAVTEQSKIRLGGAWRLPASRTAG